MLRLARTAGPGGANQFETYLSRSITAEVRECDSGRLLDAGPADGGDDPFATDWSDLTDDRYGGFGSVIYGIIGLGGSLDLAALLDGHTHQGLTVG